MVSDIFDFGVPQNVNTGPAESHHKYNGVAPSHTTQHRAQEFELQTGIQYLEHLAIGRAFEILPVLLEVVKPPTTDPLLGTRFRIEVSEGPEGDLTNVQFTWNRRKAHARYQHRHIQWIADNIAANMPGGIVYGCTEHKREDLLFRGHPQFRGLGTWHDWAMVRWDNNTTPTPAQVICFLDLTEGMVDNDEGLVIAGITHHDPGLYAVVESLSGPPIPLFGYTGMIYKGHKSRPAAADGVGDDGKIFLIPVDCIVGPATVIPDIGGPPGNYLIVAQQRKWSLCFTSFIQPTTN